MADAAPVRSDAAPGFSERLAGLGPTYGALAALVLLVVGNLLFTPGFASAANMWNILLQVSTTVLVAIGMTFVIATGGIDLSVGSVMAVASAISATQLGLGVPAAVLIGLASGLGIGALNGVLITAFRIQPIIVSLAALITGRGVAQVISDGGQIINFSNPAFETLGKGYVGPVPVQVLIMSAALLAGIFLLRETSFGRYVLAIGGNEAASRLAGVAVNRTKIAVYTISGLLAALAGMIETARLAAADAGKVGMYMELDAIAAVVVGGTALSGGKATVLGTIVGALIMQVITTSFNMNGIAFSLSLVLKAAIILLAVYVQRPKVA